MSDDLKNKGVDRSTSYLEKVAGLNVHKTFQEWNRIKKIQEVRNIVAHRDGRVEDGELRPIKAVLNYIDETQPLSGNGEIILKEGFLASVVDTFRAYFRLISESITANEESLNKRAESDKMK